MLIVQENNYDETLYKSTRLPLVESKFKAIGYQKWITALMLIDSGSTTNLINKKILIQNNITSEKGQPIRLNGFGEGMTATTSSEYVQVEIAGKRGDTLGVIQCLVVNGLNVSLLLGFPSIQKTFTTMEIKRNHITLYGETTVSFSRLVPQKLHFENKILSPGFNSIKISRTGNSENSHELSLISEDLSLLTDKITMAKSDHQITCNVWNHSDIFIDSQTLENCMQVDEINANNDDKKPDHYRKTLDLGKLDTSTVDIFSDSEKRYKNKLKLLIEKYNHIFCRSDSDLGCYNGNENYTINLLGPIKETYKTRTFNAVENEFIAKTIKELLANGVIEECSHSRIYTGIVLAKKKPGKDGKPKLRFCIDSTIPNQNTFCAQNFPLPVLDEQLQEMCNAKIFSSVDFLGAFWQIVLPKDQKYLYTFSFQNRCYRQRRSSFGTKGMAAFFMSLTANMFRHIEGVSVYMDDVVIHHKDFKNHLKAIEQIFEMVSKRNMVLNLEKCSFLYPSHEAYGYIVEKGTFSPNPKRIEKLLKLSFPKNLRELQAHLGSINYYRLSIKNYKLLAEPFYELSKNFELKPELRKNWDDLLKAVGKAMLRTKPNPNLPVRVITDCSATAGGVIISQKQGKYGYRPILADSYLLKGRILLAKISMKELYCVYLTLRKYRKMLKIFPKIELITDNRVVFCLLSKMSEVGVYSTDAPSRWLCFISFFTLEVKHMRGDTPEFALADIMSRNKLYDLKSTRLTIGKLQSDEALILEKSENVLNVSSSAVDAQQMLRTFNVEKIRDLIKKAQEKYDFKSNAKKDNVRLEILKISNKEKEVPIYYDRNNKLYVPKEYIDEFLQATHVHNLSNWYNNILKMKVTFTPLHKTLLLYYQNCVICQSINKKPDKFVKTTIQTSYDVGDLVYADVVHIWRRKFLAMRDHFSGFTLIHEIKSENEKDITDGFILLICQLFVPRVIQTDNQKSLTSKKFQELCDTLNIRLRHSTSRNSRSAGFIERHFRTLRSVLKVMFQSEDDLAIQVSVANFVINNRKGAGSDLTPYQKLTLRTNNYPINLPSTSLSKLKTLDPNYANFHKAASDVIEEIRQKQFQQKVGKDSTKLYKKGDRILIKSYPTGKHTKTQPYYSKEIFVVKKTFPHTKTYEVEKEEKDDKIHRQKFLIHHRLTTKLSSNQKEAEKYDETSPNSEEDDSSDEIDRFHENDNQIVKPDDSTEMKDKDSTQSGNLGKHGYSLRSRN